MNVQRKSRKMEDRVIEWWTEWSERLVNLVNAAKLRRPKSWSCASLSDRSLVAHRLQAPRRVTLFLPLPSLLSFSPLYPSALRPASRSPSFAFSIPAPYTGIRVRYARRATPSKKLNLLSDALLPLFSTVRLAFLFTFHPPPTPLSSPCKQMDPSCSSDTDRRKDYFEQWCCSWCWMCYSNALLCFLHSFLILDAGKVLLRGFLRLGWSWSLQGNFW